ncbi:hypothetical protein NOCARDAX2BIS_480018 [Nocardioides sp. AX2bis]|nr:hypothetical protein NOCARDAX2BIS_480018 [Nocardioides sp. AX2bis]
MATRATSASSSLQVRLRPDASTRASLSGDSRAAWTRRSSRPAAVGGGAGGSTGGAAAAGMGGYFHTPARRAGDPAGRRPAALGSERDPVGASSTAAGPAPALDPGRGGRRGGGRGRERAQPGRRPHVGGVLRRRQHRHAGREHLPPRPRPAPARVLHHPRHRRRRLEAGLLPGGRRRGPRPRLRDPRGRALLHRRAHRGRARGAQRGDLRRDHVAPDLARHPRAGPAAPGPGPTGLAGDRGTGRDRPHHRAAPRPDRRDGHGRRARRRRLHRPAGRRHAARPGQGRGDPGALGARGPGPGALLGLLRLRQRPADAVAGRRRLRREPRRPAAGPRPRRGVAGARLPDRTQGRPRRPGADRGRRGPGRRGRRRAAPPLLTAPRRTPVSQVSRDYTRQVAPGRQPWEGRRADGARRAARARAGGPASRRRPRPARGRPAAGGALPPGDAAQRRDLAGGPGRAGRSVRRPRRRRLVGGGRGRAEPADRAGRAGPRW